MRARGRSHDGAPRVTETWALYVTAVQALAEADGDIAFLSHVDSFGGYIDPPGGGLVDGDRVHASDAGNAVMADTIAALLA